MYPYSKLRFLQLDRPLGIKYKRKVHAYHFVKEWWGFDVSRLQIPWIKKGWIGLQAVPRRIAFLYFWIHFLEQSWDDCSTLHFLNYNKIKQYIIKIFCIEKHLFGHIIVLYKESPEAFFIIIFILIFILKYIAKYLFLK